MEVHVFKNFFLMRDLTFPLRRSIKLPIGARDWHVLVARFSKYQVCNCMGYWPSLLGQDVWVLDQVWGQDGWVLATSFFACLWTETKSRSINSQKQNEANIHLDRTNLVNKGFIIWLSAKFFMLNTAGSHEQARWLHLTCSGSKSRRVIWFILPARGASHIIKLGIGHVFFWEFMNRDKNKMIHYMDKHIAQVCGAQPLSLGLSPGLHMRESVLACHKPLPSIILIIPLLYVLHTVPWRFCAPGPWSQCCQMDFLQHEQTSPWRPQFSLKV